VYLTVLATIPHPFPLLLQSFSGQAIPTDISKVDDPDSPSLIDFAMLLQVRVDFATTIKVVSAQDMKVCYADASVMTEKGRYIGQLTSKDAY